MAFNKLTSRIKKAVNDYKDELAEKKANENERQNQILAGKIEPIQVVVNLDPDEKAYVELSAKRMALVDSIIEKTTGTTKKKGVVGRAVVGGVLLGPIGALGGATTAGSRTNSTTTQKTVSKVQQVDQGKLIFTNKRFIFLGQQVLSVPYNELLATSFTSKFGANAFSFKYEGMLKGESYLLAGEKAKDTELYYRGITNNLLLTDPVT
jgi:hypothetical protein